MMWISISVNLTLKSKHNTDTAIVTSQFTARWIIACQGDSKLTLYARRDSQQHHVALKRLAPEICYRKVHLVLQVQNH